MSGIFDGIKATAANIPEADETGTYTDVMFLDDFPQFKKLGEEEYLLPKHMLQLFLENVNKSVLPSKWGSMWRYAAGLYVAHFSAMYLRTYTNGSANAMQVAADSQQPGMVKSATMGDTSISYDNSAVTAGMEKWGTWNATQYGQQLVAMARLVGMGGSYVI